VQLLGYLGRLYLKQALRTPILPLVLYHGARPFTRPRRFAAGFTLSPPQQALLQPYLPDFEYLLCDLSHWQPPVEPSLAIQVFFAGLRSAASGDLERTRRLLELAARLYGEQNGARIVHALLDLFVPRHPARPGHRAGFADPSPT
jgi:hypothetical protein